jgi:hypothetical protein
MIAQLTLATLALTGHAVNNSMACAMIADDSAPAEVIDYLINQVRLACGRIRLSGLQAMLFNPQPRCSVLGRPEGAVFRLRLGVRLWRCGPCPGTWDRDLGGRDRRAGNAARSTGRC